MTEEDAINSPIGLENTDIESTSEREEQGTPIRLIALRRRIQRRERGDGACLQQR